MWSKIHQIKLIFMLMFLVGVLAPTGWVSAIATATTPPRANQSPSLTPQPTALPLSARSSNVPLDVFCDGTRQPNTTLNPVSISATESATVGGLVWLDEDGDGLQDEGEAGLEGVVCAVCQANQLEPVSTTMTDVDGFYNFELATTDTDSYYLVFQPSDEYMFTMPNVGDDDSIDSDVVDADFGLNLGVTEAFQVMPGQNDETWKVGLMLRPATAVHLGALTATQALPSAIPLALILLGLLVLGGRHILRDQKQ